jgi:large subunit ribosomal protein L4e
MSARPTITVYNHEDKKNSTESLPLPAVFTAPIRPDIVNTIHNSVARNKRQARGVSLLAGHQTSAESWGTGRAVARIPRVGGSGTHRSGQAAFGNMCRGGHMFAPLKVYRKWQQKTNLNERRHAVASALAASAVAPLVMARGHKIENVSEIPLVVESLNSKKAKDILKALENLGLKEELKRVALSKKIRTGKGKMRNRRYVKRRGPLIIHDISEKEVRLGARNILGVDTCRVQKLNILQLAPGGHVGRLIVWTKKAFQNLNTIFGTYKRPGVEKGGYRLQRHLLNSADLSRLINSDQVQSAIRAPKTNGTHLRKKNPLKNRVEMKRLNPFDQKRKELEQQLQADRSNNRKNILKQRRAHKLGQEFIKDFKKNVNESQKRDEVEWYAVDKQSEHEEEEDNDDHGNDNDEEEDNE